MRGIAKAMAPIQRGLRLMISRALVLMVNDATKLQALQVSLLDEEVRDDAERFQQYGFTSAPHPGAEAVAVSVGGQRDHVVVLAVDDRRYRLRALQQGEVALYTDEGDRIVLKRGGVVLVQAATKVQLQTPLVELSGSMTVAGSITAGGDVLAAGISAVHHTHPDVAPGTASTGEPE